MKNLNVKEPNTFWKDLLLKESQKSFWVNCKKPYLKSNAWKKEAPIGLVEYYETKTLNAIFQLAPIIGAVGIILHLINRLKRMDSEKEC